MIESPIDGTSITTRSLATGAAAGAGIATVDSALIGGKSLTEVSILYKSAPTPT